MAYTVMIPDRDGKIEDDSTYHFTMVLLIFAPRLLHVIKNVTRTRGQTYSRKSCRIKQENIYECSWRINPVYGNIHDSIDLYSSHLIILCYGEVSEYIFEDLLSRLETFQGHFMFPLHDRATTAFTAATIACGTSYATEFGRLSSNASFNNRGYCGCRSGVASRHVVKLRLWNTMLDGLCCLVIYGCKTAG